MSLVLKNKGQEDLKKSFVQSTTTRPLTFEKGLTAEGRHESENRVVQLLQHQKKHQNHIHEERKGRRRETQQ
jgi:hypothetical protein